MAVRSEIGAGTLRKLVDRSVELTFALCGVTDRDEVTCLCRIVAVAQAVDSRGRFVAVVEMPEDTTAIAIPTTRIRSVVPIDGTFSAKRWSRNDDRGVRRELAAKSG